jgi:ArsR family transcriptional regulator
MKTATVKSRVDVMFRAFSDRTRLRILNLLKPGELCVCDLVRALELPQPKVSRHLAYLKKAGLVTGRKDGLWMYYALTPAKNAFHQKLMECLSCCFQDVPDLGKDVKRLGRSNDATGTCCG